MGNTYFISDIHAYHGNVLRFDGRPFGSIEEHNNEIAKRWNEKVCGNDDVWILGDISFAGKEKTVEFYSKLNGKKHLCIGNHDKKLLKHKEVRDLFVEVADYKELSFDYGVNIVLSHYPIPCFKNHYYGWLHFYGHVHNSFEWEMMESIRNEMESKKFKPCHMFNVGCMMPYMHYTPMRWEEIVQGYNEWRLNGGSHENSRNN